MSPIVRRPSLFWPSPAGRWWPGLALCLYGSSLWLDLADPQLVFQRQWAGCPFQRPGLG